MMGNKIGMSQFIMETGIVVPITVLRVGPCTVTQIRTKEKDGYEAVQLGFTETSKSPKKKTAEKKKSNKVTGFRYKREVPAGSLEGIEIGQHFDVQLFSPGEKVDVIGTSKGRGFQGVVKRHGFGGQQRTHGQSDRLRAPGSIGMGTTPGRVFKGKKMAGHMGNRRVTVKNLEVISVDEDRNLMFIKGAIPGAPTGLVMICKRIQAKVVV
jgi:large subunit ribosomal protein L3